MRSRRRRGVHLRRESVIGFLGNGRQQRVTCIYASSATISQPSWAAWEDLSDPREAWVLLRGASCLGSRRRCPSWKQVAAGQKGRSAYSEAGPRVMFVGRHSRESRGQRRCARRGIARPQRRNRSHRHPHLAGSGHGSSSMRVSTGRRHGWSPRMLNRR